MIELVLVLIWLIPISAVIWFINCLITYRKTPRSDIEKRKNRRGRLILSAIMAGVFVLGLAVLIFVFTMSINYM